MEEGAHNKNQIQELHSQEDTYTNTSSHVIRLPINTQRTTMKKKNGIQYSMTSRDSVTQMFIKRHVDKN
jgi:hypothetical protein